MAKRQIFYSFDFDYDVMRVQQIRNIGFLEDNKPVSANKWEEIRKKGYDAIKEWVDYYGLRFLCRCFSGWKNSKSSLGKV